MSDRDGLERRAVKKESGWSLPCAIRSGTNRFTGGLFQAMICGKGTIDNGGLKEFARKGRGDGLRDTPGPGRTSSLSAILNSRVG